MSAGAEILPDGVLVSWYGDDFTGSAAVMEAMTFAGLPSVLFLDVPTTEDLARFPAARGIGIAGIARSKPPHWMDEHLPPIYAALAAINAPIAHYKICSTLDSAPHIGSIGRAIALAAPLAGDKWIPLLVAAPAIRRYQAFGNLYATLGETTYRLDRHPTMSRHPVTPMHEADVRRHLAQQTSVPIGLVDLLGLRSDPERTLRAARHAGAEIVALDCVDEADLAAVGGLIWRASDRAPFVVGSQGIEYALIAYWQKAGILPIANEPDGAGTVDRMAVVSGSCAPQTAAQIAHALQNGFAPVRVDARDAIDAVTWNSAVADAVAQALAAIDAGRDPLIFTAIGPDDPSVAAFNEAIEASGSDQTDVNARVGDGLGRVLGTVSARAGLGRGVIAGGDTSGHGALALGIRALTALAPTIPGAALCQAHFSDPAHAPFEIALKGGQMGSPDYFNWIKQGGGAAAMRSKAA